MNTHVSGPHSRGDLSCKQNFFPRMDILRLICNGDLLDWHLDKERRRVHRRQVKSLPTPALRLPRPGVRWN